MRSEAAPLVSVIIPVGNEVRHIAACIAALQNQTYPANRLEFVVADGSSDGSAEVLAGLVKDEPRLKVLRSPTGRTPVSLNLAIGASTGSVICRMDAHAVPDPAYVQLCVAELKASGAWAVGGRMAKRGFTALGAAIAAASSSKFGVGDSSFHYASSRTRVESVYLGCWPRETFERVGSFDEDLTRNQDDEFSYRIREAGGEIWFNPDIVVTYRPRETLRELFDQHRQYGYWKIRVFRKHPRSIRWRHLVPGALLAALASTALAAFDRRALLFGISLAAVYGAGAILAAGIVAPRSSVRRRDVTMAYFAMHLGYGIGLWQGLGGWLRSRLRPALAGKGMTATREEPMLSHDGPKQI